MDGEGEETLQIVINKLTLTKREIILSHLDVINREPFENRAQAVPEA